MKLTFTVSVSPRDGSTKHQHVFCIIVRVYFSLTFLSLAKLLDRAG